MKYNHEYIEKTERAIDEETDQPDESSKNNTLNVIDAIIETSVSQVNHKRSASEGETLLGECLDEDHPVLSGRVLIRWTDPLGTEHRAWIPTLSHLSVRLKDRVLITKPTNWNEPIVTGVVDGFPRRKEKVRPAGMHLALKADESVRITDNVGTELIEIQPSENGPKVRLLTKGINLEMPGRLRLKADSVEIEAGAGSLKLKAVDDVIVRGEIIELN